MKNLLIYYGYPNSFNSAVNSWNNEKVAQDMAKYNLIVLGNGLDNPSHADYSNACTIINRLKEIKPNILIFGYVTADQDYSDFKLKTGRWNDMGIHGIFLDEAGYDYGKTRVELNERLNFVHSQESANICFVNAWKQDHILGLENDASYPNATYNPDLVESLIGEDDWILMESFPVNTLSYTGSDSIQPKADCFTRVDNLLRLKEDFDFKVACSNVINDDNANGQLLHDFGFMTALMVESDAFGTSSIYYGASTAQVKFWEPVDVIFTEPIDEENAVIENDNNDNDVYHKYLEKKQIWLDFSSGAKDCGIESY